MHPDLIDATQLKHLYGPVVYAAQALGLSADGSPVGERVLTDALSTATESVRSLAGSMPALPVTKTRLSHMYAVVLDAGLR